VSIEVHDSMLGDGSYLLRGDASGATCEPTDRRADVELDAAALGAVFLGGVRLESLVRAGVVRAHDNAAVVRLDRALLADRLPMYGTGF
jgi:predicted acetyltransferase